MGGSDSDGIVISGGAIKTLGLIISLITIVGAAIATKSYVDNKATSASAEAKKTYEELQSSILDVKGEIQNVTNQLNNKDIDNMQSEIDDLKLKVYIAEYKLNNPDKSLYIRLAEEVEEDAIEDLVVEEEVEEVGSAIEVLEEALEEAPENIKNLQNYNQYQQQVQQKQQQIQQKGY